MDSFRSDLKMDSDESLENYAPNRKKPRLFGKKKFYKKEIQYLREQLRHRKGKHIALEKKYNQLLNRIGDVYQTYGDHYHMYMNGENVQLGSNNTMTCDLDTSEIIELLETLLKRTTQGLKDAIKMQAEGAITIQSLKESLTTMSNKLGMMEAETRGGMVSLSRQSSEIMVKVDNMKEFARLAQDPNPTADMVTETVSSILVHVGTANNESRVGGLHNLPTTAQTFPKLLAIKYGSKNSSDLQRVLLGSTREEPGSLEDRCTTWLIRWVRRQLDKRGHDASTDVLANDIQKLLKQLDNDIISAQEKAIIRQTVQDRGSVSSGGSSRTITGPCLTHQREILEKLEEIKVDNQRELRDLTTELKEFRELKNILANIEALRSVLENVKPMVPKHKGEDSLYMIPTWFREEK